MNHSIRARKDFKFCGLALPKLRFQFLWAKMVGNPETPGVNPDTPEKSGYKIRIFRVLQNCGRRVVSGSGLVLACVVHSTSFRPRKHSEVLVNSSCVGIFGN